MNALHLVPTVVELTNTVFWLFIVVVSAAVLGCVALSIEWFLDLAAATVYRVGEPRTVSGHRYPRRLA